MTKIDIFSGFLGAGKTTLIKKLIAEAYTGEQLVLIENEFGEIGIDGGFLQEAGINITEMNSGCICCSLVGDFGKALRQVMDTYHPDRILIEPSGVGKLSDVIRAVQDLQMPDVVLNGFTTVVDAAKAKMYMKNFGEFFNNQVEHASAIILSRTGGMKQDKLDACVALLREKNPTATIVTTPWDELDGKQLLAAMERRDTLAAALEELAEEQEHHHHHHEHGEECGCGCHDHEHHHHEHGEECGCGCHDHEHHHHEHGEECGCGCHDHEHHPHEHGEECGCGCHDHEHHHADEVFTSWGRETAHPYEQQELAAALQALDTGDYGQVLRAKGIVAGTDGKWLHFDYVPGEVEVRTGAAGVTGRLCVIGAELKENALTSLFHLD
ncbi:MAG: GTP-binding protein [Enterocloster clostridioformis]|nr:GTP-binding protein [Enterocloster clostridioformis]